MTTNGNGERTKQRAHEVIGRARDYAEKARNDHRDYTEALFAIGTRVLEEGEYPPQKMLSDAVATTLHGFSIWASWWMPLAPGAADGSAKK